MNLFERPGFTLLERSLDASSLRQKVTANNIANAETPHFKRSEVEFERLLREAMEAGGRLTGTRTHEKHLPIGRPRSLEVAPRVVQDDSESMMNHDGNNVDLDYEMSMMAQNQLYYNLLIQQTGHEISMLRTSIGRR